MNRSPLRAGRAAPASLLERRARLPQVRDQAIYQPGVSISDETLGGIACMICEPTERRGTILYLHGGGYRLGTPAAWAGVAARIAATSACRVVVPDYSLAPERPYPAAIFDAMAVYGALLRSGDVPLVAGDSAGGGLATAVALACRMVSLPMPRGLALLSPWLDLTCPEQTLNGAAANDPLFPRTSALEAAEQYLQGHKATDPLASPLHGDLAGLPPILLFASGAEYLLGDVLAFQSKIACSGGTADICIRPGLPHAWPVVSPESPDARATFERIGFFVAQIRSARRP